jgi:hypothetical protein
VFPVGIGLRDPRSQKRDLGHPSIRSLRYWGILRFAPSIIVEGTGQDITLSGRGTTSDATRTTICVSRNPVEAGQPFCHSAFLIPKCRPRAIRNHLGMKGSPHLDASPITRKMSAN